MSDISDSISDSEKLSFWDHLDVLRNALLKIAVVTVVFGIVAFMFKDTLFAVVLAPKESGFITYRLLSAVGGLIPGDSMPDFHVSLINTGLAEQFIIHLKTAMCAGILCASPYILYQLFVFVSPALYDNERRYAVRSVGWGYVMFIIGVLVSYFLIFPLTFRFLGTYQVSDDVTNMISLQSYMSTLILMCLSMGIVFEMPVLAWLFAKLGFLTPAFMRRYRKHAIVLILVIAAVITPTSDVFTLLLVSLPMWLLYEASILIIRERKPKIGMKQALPLVIGLLTLCDPYGASAAHIRSYYWGLGANQYTSISQAPDGVMWFGTDNGVLSYNGYQIRQIPGSDRYVYALAVTEDGEIWYSDEDGLHRYQAAVNERTDIDLKCDIGIIEALVAAGKDIVIGSTGGVYIYNTDSEKCGRINGIGKASRLSLGKDRLFAATDKKLLILGFPSLKMEGAIDLDNVSSLFWDDGRDCLWIGTNGKLLKYQPDSGRIESVISADTYFKSVTTGNGRLYIGSDNGLFELIPETGEINLQKHDVNDPQTIGNDVVWSLASDKNGNVWVGTSHGVSLVQNQTSYELFPISFMSRSVPGLNSDHFTTMLRDYDGNLWLGGNNGLIRESPSGDFSWYHKEGGKSRGIPHNNIRKVYQGPDGNVWVATDGGLLRYDSEEDRFISYSITDKSGKDSAEWVYDVYDDGKGRLWVGTFSTGMFIVSKAKLMESSGSVMADKIEDVCRGDVDSLGDHLYYIKGDKNGKVWIGHRNGLAEADPESMMVTDVAILNEKGEYAHFGPQNVTMDDVGNLWYTVNNHRLAKVDMANRDVALMPEDAFDGMRISRMIFHDGCLWGVTGKELTVYNPYDKSSRHISIPDYDYISMCYDSIGNRLLLGGYDALLSVDPDIRENRAEKRDISITGVYGNGHLMVVNPRDMSFPSSVTQLSFEISDFLYGQTSQYGYEYRLDRGDDAGNSEWASLPVGDNSLYFHGLTPGSYTLELRTSLNKDFITAYRFKILPPWYLTLWAKIIYCLIAVILIYLFVRIMLKRNKERYERIERERVLELSRMKMDFFTNMSHELKTPLSLIIAPLDKLLAETPDNGVKSQIEGVRKNALRLNSLIQRVLDFKKISGKDDLLVRSRVEMCRLVKSVTDSFRQAAENRNISISCKTPTEDIWLNIDLFKMETVLYNVLSNAVKFVEDNIGIIAITLDCDEKKSVTVTVSDNGHGIPKEDLNMVWMRLYQGHNKERNPHGSGIGLYLVKKYVSLHGGNVSLDSVLGKGTTMTLNIPLTEENTKFANDISSGDTAQSVEDASKKKLLIIDDNEELRDFIKSAFTLTYNCHQAVNGEEGLQIAKEIKPDIIIVDEMMPVMTGMEFCKRIKKLPFLASIPVIMLTAKDDNATELESISVGADVFMSKPFDLSRLSLRIEQLLESRKLIAKRSEQAQMVEKASDIKEPVENSDEKMMKEVLRVIEDNLGDPDFNVSILCDKTGIGSKKMLRLIKAQIGTTPVGFIRQIRMKKAALLLQQKRFSIAEVMYMVGFSHTSYFAKSFTEEFGMSPKEYMEQSK